MLTSVFILALTCREGIMLDRPFNLPRTFVSSLNGIVIASWVPWEGGSELEISMLLFITEYAWDQQR